MERTTAQGERAVERLARLEASIRALPDDDLLYLADMFRGSATPRWAREPCMR
jgi:hypothetical protein